MEFPADVRWVALPCVFVASVLQYLPFAKKPMAFPCHRITQGCARKTVFIGLAAEMAGLRFLPLCQAYPMNASLLVFLYFWKESKRSMRMGELLASLTALSAWAVPFLDPANGKIPEPMQVGVLIDVMLAPRTCVYVVGLLLSGIVFQCLSGWLCRESALMSCVPPALNFGVTALLLKAGTHVVLALLLTPARTELWLALLTLGILLLGVRSAAAGPLRRAMEANDNLSILANYGFVSGVAAAVTGGFVFGELESWSRDQKLAYLVAAAVHCWGMRQLGLGFAESRGAGKLKADEETGAASPAPGNAKKSRSEGRTEGLQMVEVGGRGKGAADRAGGPGAGAAIAAAALEADQPLSPLLLLNEPRTVDDDAAIEEQLFARVLGTAGAADIGISGIQHAGAGAFGQDASSGFDADWEEIMRRFEEDDKGMDGPASKLTELAEGLDLQHAPSAADAAPPAVLTFDAQTLLDSNEDVLCDEDELLKNIEDIC